jgi:hypothetical protein
MKKIFIFILLLLTSCQNNNIENENITGNEKINKTILSL